MSGEIRGRDSITNAIDPVKITSNNLHVAQYVWDINTLSWIKQTISAGGGAVSSDVSVVNTVGLTDAQLRATPLAIQASDFSERVDDLTSTLYIGKAALGSSESASVWSIKRVQFVGSTIVTTWANGSNSFNNSWASRASYSYS